MVAQASVRLTEPQDLEWVLPHCSSVELRTLEQMYDDTPESLLRIAIYSDRRPYTGLINNRPVCIFGVYNQTMLSEEIYVWLLGSRSLRDYPVLFMKHCKPIFEYLTRGFDVVKTSLDLRNEKAVRLAKFLKFQVVSNESWHAKVQLRRH